VNIGRIVGFLASIGLMAWAFIDMTHRRGGRWPWVLLILAGFWLTGALFGWVVPLIYLTVGRQRLAKT
jgi:hypothetical protein